MALIKPTIIERPGFAGQLSADVYWRVADVNGSKIAMVATFEGLVSGVRIETFEVTFAPDLAEGAPNVIAQAYAQAKKLPHFSGAIDA